MNGEYALTRTGTGIVSAKLIVTDAVDGPKIEWLNHPHHPEDSIKSQLSNYLKKLAGGSSEKSYSIGVEELLWGGGECSIELICEALEGAFKQATSNKPKQHGAE